jgi:hypothetical protein
MEQKMASGNNTWGMWELWEHHEKTIGKTYGMFYSLSSFLKLKYYHTMHDFYNVIYF